MKIFATTLIYYLAAGLNFFVAFLQYTQNHNTFLAALYVIIGIIFFVLAGVYEKKMKEQKELEKKTDGKNAKKETKNTKGNTQRKKK